MLSYMSLLVLVLATSSASPVRAADPPKIEGTSQQSESLKPRYKPKVSHAVMGLLAVSFLGIMLGNIYGSPHHDFSPKNKPTNSNQPTPPTNNTIPTNSTQPTPPRRRGLSVDTSKARSVSDNDNQKMHTSSPDLLNRDQLEEALGLFRRTLDGLD